MAFLVKSRRRLGTPPGTGLTPGTQYRARVRAANGAGESAYSDWATFTTTATAARPYFQAADWHWDPIPTDPVLDAKSATWAGLLSTTAGSQVRIANLVEFGVGLTTPTEVTEATPRYTVPMDRAAPNPDNWGPHPWTPDTLPFPAGTAIPTGSDGHIGVADPTTGQVFNAYKFMPDGAGGYKARFGSKVSLAGDGREPLGMTSTGCNIARYACVVRESEIATGYIPHALFFSTNMAQGPANSSNFRYPAVKTDGSNMAGVADPIPEGARIQLDPSLDIDALPNMTAAERTIAKALQTFGAYCGDNGGARMAFIFELSKQASGSNPGPVYSNAGLNSDYKGLNGIPWASLRVLKNWNGAP